VPDTPLLGLEQARDQAQQGALAAAVAAHQHPEASMWQAEIAVIESPTATGPGEAESLHLQGDGSGCDGRQLSNEKPGRLPPPPVVDFS
jgi:hypothetical protein